MNLASLTFRNALRLYSDVRLHRPVQRVMKGKVLFLFENLKNNYAVRILSNTRLALAHNGGSAPPLSNILSTFEQNEIIRKTCKLIVRLSHYFEIRLYVVVTF